MRNILLSSDTIIIKIGSRILLQENGYPNKEHIQHLVEQIAYLHKNNKKVAFVSSGAIGCGMQALGFNQRPASINDLQACAAIGQILLMRIYQDFFSSFNIQVAQVLLTYDDFKNKIRNFNIKNTIHTLWQHSVIPIINENDTVSIDEIKFGDNDVLASLLAVLLEVKALLLLTTVDGFIKTYPDGTKKVIDYIGYIDEEILMNIEEAKPGLSLGGMKSKIMAASNIMEKGGCAIIAPGYIQNVIIKVFNAEIIGTFLKQALDD